MGCRIRTIAAAVAVCVVPLAACTADPPHPAPTPPPSSVATTPLDSTTLPAPTTSAPRTGPLTTGPNVRPGEHPPSYPELARHHNAMGALAFARYFYAAIDWGYATNDGYLVAQLGLPSCSACRRYLLGLRSVSHRHGAVLIGGRVRIRGASAFQGDLLIRSDYAIDVELDEDVVVLRQPGHLPKALAPEVRRFHSLVFVAWHRGAWTVVEVTDKQ